MDFRAYRRGVVLDYSHPGKPTCNAFIEACNGRFRTEWLNRHGFMALADGTERREAWRRCHIEERPRGATENKVPIMLTQSGAPPARHPERSRNPAS
ncbi:hypothetical protein D2N39_17085 [Gemmobacter lutimaris]|uniref:Integrase catalytic domain-containing protein n=1 Tax=Gemmobacter lutimaris TaxID=2306023 RepID=A0A398BJ18_9RHOB|nr:hypothetical protein D2N39_17085 [Gemmobacter lutimaris]